MDAAWQVLMPFGLPDGPARPAPTGPLDERAVVDAVACLDGMQLSTHEREVLLAWLAAFEHHWGDRYRRSFGDLGISLLARLRGGEYDINRFLKLRRIAIENLAAVL